MYPFKNIFIIGVFLLLLFVSLTDAEAAICTYTVGSGVAKIDGNGNYAQVRPGDVLCLQAGVRDDLQITNLHGTLASPITIQNTGGVVSIQNSTDRGAIDLVNTSHLKISGAGVSTKCGAEYTVAQQECGIELGFVSRGVAAKDRNNGLEVEYVYIHDSEDPGIKYGEGHGDYTQTLTTGVFIHHNYINNTGTEGLYIGDHPQDTNNDNVMECIHEIQNVRIHNNLVTNTKWDGVNVKCAVSNVQVHHNIMRNVGYTTTQSAQDKGLSVTASIGDYYNNLVDGTHGEGIRMLHGTGIASFYNNIVLNTGANGMLANSQAQVKVYNNTFVNNGGNGIEAQNGQAEIYDNIIVGTTGRALVTGANTLVQNNYTGTVASAGFVNATSKDYHLTAGSPAVDTGRSSGTFPNFDYDDRARPQGTKTDLGAYERISTSVTATPTVTATSTATPTLARIPGDANGDGKVDGIDYITWLTNYNQTVTGGASKGDFNNSGVVDGVDYIVWLTNYGK